MKPPLTSIMSCNRNTHFVRSVFFPFRGRMTATEKQQKTTRGQEDKSSRNPAFVILLTQMKSHLGMCMCVSEKTESDCCMFKSCVCLCLKEWVKLLHSTLGLLPNACHPACPLPLAYPFLTKNTWEEKGENTGRRGQKSRGRACFPTNAQVRTCHAVPFTDRNTRQSFQRQREARLVWNA